MNTQFISGVNDLLTLAPDVAAMWDYDKNPNGITPSDVSVGTSKKYWFKCPICHTSEYVSVKVMTGMKPDGTSFKSKRRCRRCRGDHDISTQGALIPGKIKHKSNSLIELLPDLVTRYWDYEKNNELGVYPESIGANSNITAWWICSECGKSFPMRINKRTGFINRNGEQRKEERAYCQFCGGTGRENKTSLYTGYNDLLTICPDLVKSEWDYEKNEKEGIYPDLVGFGSSKKAWWKCPEGHSYQMKICKKTGMAPNGKVIRTPSQCPICSGQTMVSGINDLATAYPDIAKHWDYEKNDTTPDKVHFGSGHVYWWVCDKGHHYRCDVWSLTHGIRNNEVLGCPYCTGRYAIRGENDFATLYPQVLECWDYEKNELKPDEIKPSSHNIFWFKCPECGTSYQSFPYNVVKSFKQYGVCNCPNCGTSRGEQSIMKFISDWIHESCQNADDISIIRNDRKALGDSRELDIYLTQLHLAIEFDGIYWHSIGNMKANNQPLFRDAAKTEQCDELGIRLIHVYESDWTKYYQAFCEFLIGAIIEQNADYDVLTFKDSVTNVSNIALIPCTKEELENVMFSDMLDVTGDVFKVMENDKECGYVSYQIEDRCMSVDAFATFSPIKTIDAIENFAANHEIDKIQIKLNRGLNSYTTFEKRGYRIIKKIAPYVINVTSHSASYATLLKDGDISEDETLQLYSVGEYVVEKTLDK